MESNINKKIRNCALLILMISLNMNIFLLGAFYNDSYFNISFLNNKSEEDNPKSAAQNYTNTIIFFKKPTYNITVESNFTNYGGFINERWNNTFNMISGFSGTLPTENITDFSNNWKDAFVEIDEVVKAQMNYATIQTGAEAIHRKLQASAIKYAINYNDEVPEGNKSVFENATNNCQSLLVNYDLTSHGISILTGVKYKYVSNGQGPYTLNITYWGQDIKGTLTNYKLEAYDTNIPNITGSAWRTIYQKGPVYLMNKMPKIQFNSSDNSINCTAISADTPKNDRSFYDYNSTGPHTDLNYEYIVQLIYEEIPVLEKEIVSASGNIVANNYVDGYFVNLIKDKQYEFIVDRTSGIGTLNLTLLTYNTLTDTHVQTVVASAYPQKMVYTPTTTGTYVLLVEPNTPDIDTANYTIKYQETINDNFNSSIAVLDSGINPNHQFFPNGYNEENLSGNIIGWENFVDSATISDDNGHGTFISSVIAGTGTQFYNSNEPTKVNLYGNYSHMELFGNEYIPPKNYTFKLFSFNASKTNALIVINSTGNWKPTEIDKFWFELYNQTKLVNRSLNVNPNQYYVINHNSSVSRSGIYDVYLKYHKLSMAAPNFSFNLSISYFPEVYTEDTPYFSGIMNRSKIVSYKVINQSGLGYTSDLISSLAKVIQNKEKYHIISVCLSLGTLGDDVAAINTVIDEVIKEGILIVIAAGNTGIQGSDPLNKLALNKNAIVVGATNDDDQITTYSSMGKEVENGVIKPDIVAPGGSSIAGHRSIINADAKSNLTTGAYGTSIATAIVCAAINMIIEAKWNNWDQWNSINLTQRVKIIKSTLLMTASETNLAREDDPATEIDEGSYSPSRYLQTLTTGLKDVHEGYGRLNIQTAIDALTKNIFVGTQINGTLTSSIVNPLGTHAIAHRINFTADHQYFINFTQTGIGADFDVYLYSNESNQYGEPILITASRKFYGDLTNFYFVPRENETECVLIVKAISGSGTFKLNISEIINIYEPTLEVPEVLYADGTENTTVMSYQKFIGNSPDKNYTIDRYYFFINFFDNDTTPVPPQEIYVSIEGQNYTLTQLNPADTNYTDGALFWSAAIQFSVAKTYHYFFVASDGLHSTRYPEEGDLLSIKIEYPAGSKKFPYLEDFKNIVSLPSIGWTTEGTGWQVITQANYLLGTVIDDRTRVSTVYGSPLAWQTVYFGYTTNFIAGMDYSYQPFIYTDPYPNGSLTSPLFNLTGLTQNTQPFAKFGLRASINSLDFVYLQINLNWSGWTTIRTYTNTEREWFMEVINLTQYKENFVQFRFETALNNIYDPIKNKGFMVDYFAIENYTNKFAPEIFAYPTVDYINPDQGSKFESFAFSCEYLDKDNQYPEFVYLEMAGANYTMLNIYGDWSANSSGVPDNGILFRKSLVIGDITNRSFRFHVSDGKTTVSSLRYNQDNSAIQFINPAPMAPNTYQSGKEIGYQFPNNSLNSFYIAGYPTPDDATAWLTGDNTWHTINLLGVDTLYGGIGQISYGTGNLGYGTNWDAKLITRPFKVGSEYTAYLEYGFNISLQPEVPPLYFGTNPDRCIVSISTDYGTTWSVLREYRPDSAVLNSAEKIDLSGYSDEVVIVMFTLHSNSVTTLGVGVALGWFLYNIYIGYDPATDFINPIVKIESPESKDLVSGEVTIKAKLTDDIGIDISRIQLFIEDEAVAKGDLEFDSKKDIVKFTWDTSKYNDGLYEIIVVAFDDTGNRAEDSIIVQVENGVFDWNKWAPWVIVILIAVIAAFFMFFVAEKKGKGWVQKIKSFSFEKERIKAIDRDQAVKQIQEVENVQLNYPLTLHCKFCNSWYSTDQFDIMCPNCDHDQIYAAYNCLNCKKWYFENTPGENYYCPQCTPKVIEKTGKRFWQRKRVINERAGIKLVRREKEDVEEILAQDGKILKEFEVKKKRAGILD